jgi:hypothetical protein
VPPPPPPTAKYVTFVRFAATETVQLELHTKYVYVPEVIVDVGETEKLSLGNENPIDSVFLILFKFISISPASVTELSVLIYVMLVDGL